MRRLLPIALLVWLVPSLRALTAQVTSLRVNVPSPTAASLGRFGDIPVSLSRGVPDITIPLFTAKGRTLELPIRLRYHGGGIRVEEIGSWVGIGWTLEAGGVITRSVRGLVDDRPDGYLSTGHIFYNDANWLTPDAALIENIRIGMVDPEPDQYFFSFAGRSGEFWAGPTTTVQGVFEYRSIPHEKLRIEPTLGGPQGAISAWTITAEDGTRYTFAAAESHVDQTIGAPLPPGKRFQFYEASWHLTEIRSVGGDMIRLQYTTYQARHRQGRQEQRVDLLTGNCSAQDIGASNEFDVTAQRLTSITTAAHAITFTPGTDLRADALSPTGASQEPRLDLISVATASGTLLRRFKFEQNYSTGRLTLMNVFEEDRSGARLPPYTFAYEAPTLPLTSSLAQDHWGFYNGIPNTTLIPTVVAPGGQVLPGGDRRPDPAFAKAGLLKRITYPTGGWNEFFWEANDYSTVVGIPVMGEGPVQTSYLPPSVGQSAVFTVGGTTNAVATIAHSRGPEDCESQYFRCPHSKLTGPGVDWTFIGNGGADVTLAPGTYTIRTVMNFGGNPPDPWASISVQWRDYGPLDKVTGGGLRVAELRAADGMGNVTVRKYRYTLASQPARSSGDVTVEPVYSLQFQGFNCQYFVRGSFSRMPLGDGGGLVGYREVIVWHGPTGEFGKTLHRFRTATDAPDGSLPEGAWPFLRRPNYGWKRGQEWLVREQNATDQLQRQTRTVYSFLDDTDHPTTRRQRALSISFFADGSLEGYAYKLHPFVVLSAWMHPESDTTTVYDESGGSSFLTARSFVYGNPQHLQLTEVTETNSDGTQRITRMKYPADYAPGSPPAGSEADAIRLMQTTAHIHSPVVERWVIQLNGSSAKVVQAEVTTFKEFTPGKVLPHQHFTLNAPSPLP